MCWWKKTNASDLANSKMAKDFDDHLHCRGSIFLFLEVMTNANVCLIGLKVMYQQNDLTCITRNILEKYQSSNTHCLNGIFKAEVSVRMTERRNDRMTVSCKKKKLTLQRFQKVYLNNKFILANLSPKISKIGRK